MASRRDRRAREGGWAGAPGAGAAAASAPQTYQAGASGDAKYARIVRDVDESIRSLTAAVGVITAATAKIGTAADSAALRSSTASRIVDCNKTLKALMTKLGPEMEPLIADERAMGGGSARLQQQRRYQRMASDVASRLGRASSAFSAAHKAKKAPARAAATASKTARARADEEQPLVGGSSASALESRDAAFADLAREREEEAAQISRGVHELGDIMNDLATLVDEQDAAIKKVEDNAFSAEMAAKEGNKHLEGASNSQKGYRRKLLIFVAVILLAATGITLFFVLRH